MEVEPVEVARLLKEKTIKLLDVRTPGNTPLRTSTAACWWIRRWSMRS